MAAGLLLFNTHPSKVKGNNLHAYTSDKHLPHSLPGSNILNLGMNIIATVRMQVRPHKRDQRPHNHTHKQPLGIDQIHVWLSPPLSV